MKILVHNYSSETSTEPQAFAAELKEQGHEVKMWNNEISAFDVFDSFEPEIFIGHFMMLTKDLGRRVKLSDAKMVINITGGKEEQMDYMKKGGFDCFFFQNYPVLDNVEVIHPCADLYLSKKHSPFINYAVETLFVVDKEEDLKIIRPMFDAQESFHVVTTSRDLVKLKEVDTFVPVAPLSKLYQNYDRVVVTKPNQIFYDAAYCKGVCELVGEESSVFLKKEVVESRHSPYHRVTHLLEKIGKNKNGEENVRYIGNSGDEWVQETLRG